jgi:serine/threonine-protein kinase
MELYCTRPGCPKPVNHFSDLDNPATLKTIHQKFCVACGMPLILLHRYLPLQLLGQGGFGAAFLSRDRYTPGLRYCVVKQFQPSGHFTPAELQVAQELFTREAEVLESLGSEHDQIPDLYAFFELSVLSFQSGSQSQFFYLVQEFIDGQTMEEELLQKGPFSEAEVQVLLESILPVLKFVHEHGSIHRDIKPSNIMRHRNGRLYLLDFGAVKQVTKAGESAKSTGIYSLGFAPPEQVSGNTVYPSTDLYALAVTCIVLLTGKEYNDLFDTYSHTWNWEKDAHVSNQLAAILNRMLEFSPSQRFQSAEEALQALGTTTSPQAGTSTLSSTTPQPTSSTGTTIQPAAALHTARSSPVAQRYSRFSRSPVTPFSTLELLGNAAFTGFQAGLLLFPALALGSLLGTILIGHGLWLVMIAGLIFAQYRRIIERVDLLIIAGVSLVLLLFVPDFWRFGNHFLTVIILSGLIAVGAIAMFTLFRLIYKFLSNVL